MREHHSHVAVNNIKKKSNGNDSIIKIDMENKECRHTDRRGEKERGTHTHTHTDRRRERETERHME